MNFDSLQELMRNGLQMSVGATITTLETLQDPVKREQSFAQLQQTLLQLPTTLQDPYQRNLKLQELQAELLHLSETWTLRGKSTEQEARQFVETLLAQAGITPPTGQSAPTTINITATPVTQTPASDYQRELQALIFEISSLRSELENQRQQDSE